MNKTVSDRKTRQAGLAALFVALAAGSAAMSLAPSASAADNAAAGRQLFTDWGCGACHVLKDAGAAGHVGPALDGDANLTKDFIVNRVMNGQGAMPGFAGAMTDDEISTLAEYVVGASKKDVAQN